MKRPALWMTALLGVAALVIGGWLWLSGAPWRTAETRA
jgi:hypothetical protein